MSLAQAWLSARGDQIGNGTILENRNIIKYHNAYRRRQEFAES